MSNIIYIVISDFMIIFMCHKHLSVFHVNLFPIKCSIKSNIYISQSVYKTSDMCAYIKWHVCVLVHYFVIRDGISVCVT